MTILKKSNRICPICSNGKSEILYHQKFILREEITLPDNYDLVACDQCGFVYADSLSSQSDYDEYYCVSSKYEDSQSSGSGNSLEDNVRLGKTAFDISEIINKHSSILDIGCGNGGLMFSLRDLGFINIAGLDPSLKCVEYIRSKGCTASQGTIFNHTLSTKFDCIILSHVLEHIYDLKALIDSIYNLLNEDGILYIETPDASNYCNFFFVPYYYMDIEHINHFDENSLNNLFRQYKQLKTGRKIIDLGNDKQYPCVFGFYQKTKSKTHSFSYSSYVKDSVVSFLSESNLRSKNEELSMIADTKQPVIVWGAGNYTQRLLSNSCLYKCNILAFIDKDSNKTGKLLLDKPIYQPDYLLKIHHNK